MSNWPILSGGGLIDTLNADESTSHCSAHSPASSGNTKSTYSEIIASTPRAYAGLHVTFHMLNNVASIRYLTDIAVGAAGYETVIVPNLLLHCFAYVDFMQSVFIPLAIPAGVRLAFRSSNNARAGMMVSGFAPSPLLPAGFSRMTALGVVEATTSGAYLAPSDTANTKGDYVEVSASTPHHAKALYIAMAPVSYGSTPTGFFLLDVAVGASGSEVEVYSNLPTRRLNDRRGNEPQVMGPFPVDIAAGSRIAVRAQLSDAVAGTGDDQYVTAYILG